MFLSAVSGLDWATCSRLLDERAPGSVAQAVKDADTFFGVELPALTQWTFDAEEAGAIRQPVLSVLGSDSCGCGWMLRRSFAARCRATRS